LLKSAKVEGKVGLVVQVVMCMSEWGTLTYSAIKKSQLVSEDDRKKSFNRSERPSSWPCSSGYVTDK
jgi:hypothetical protein